MEYICIEPRRGVSGTQRYKLYNTVLRIPDELPGQKIVSSRSRRILFLKNFLHDSATFHTLEWKVTGVEYHRSHAKLFFSIINDHNLYYFALWLRQHPGPVQNYRSNIRKSVSIKFRGHRLYFESLCGIGHSFELWHNQCITLKFEWSMSSSIDAITVRVGARYSLVQPNQITVSLTHNPLIA